MLQVGKGAEGAEGFDSTKDQDLLKIAAMITELPELDYEPFFKEFSQMGIYLDEDPTSTGLNNLNLKIAQIDAQKTRAGYILMLSIRHENAIEAICKFIDRVYEKRRAVTLEKAGIKELGNQNLRDAAVQRELQEILNIQNDMDISLSKAKAFTKVTQQVFNALDSTNKNISRQLTTVQTMVEIGEISRVNPNDPSKKFNNFD